jgi:hypothetical protein
VVTVEPVRVGRQHLEVPIRDLRAVKVGGGGGIHAVGYAGSQFPPRRGSRMRCDPAGKESCALVVADRVGAEANTGGELRDGQSHAVRVNLGVDSNVNPIAPWASRAGRVDLLG